jgi:glyoxylase-like metal-dependent hydrolase (beta-lactamase superfamily II)
MEIQKFTGGRIESNGYIISDDGFSVCFIVDPGYNGETYLREIAARGTRPLGILLTHNHYDHVGEAGKIKAALDCPVYMHRADAASYGGEADAPLDGGESLFLGDEEIRVLHTPGHTKGSLCFFSERSEACFTGDTIFNVDLGKTDLPDGSEADMSASVRNVADKWSDDVMIYPGHGEPCNMRFVRIYNGEFLSITGLTERFRPWNGEAFIAK